jgi:peptidoglycan-associated lipoprotein
MNSYCKSLAPAPCCRAGAAHGGKPMSAATPFRVLAIALVAMSLSACNTFVKRAEFDTTVQQLRATDRELQSQIDALQRDLSARFDSYDARFVQLEGRLRVDMTAHFDFDDARVREQDRESLSQFAEVIRDHHPNVVITVEGFTDPAGSATYNRRLGQRRAENVREYLISQGIPAQQIRAVSYGQDENRQIVPGAWGPQGEPNRRVALVIDYVG